MGVVLHVHPVRCVCVSHIKRNTDREVAAQPAMELLFSSRADLRK